MKTLAQLEAAWRQAPPLPADRGVVRGIVIRLGGGAHRLLDAVEISPEQGVHGDRWLTDTPAEGQRQVTLMMAPIHRLLVGEADAPQPGDNLIVELDLSETTLPVGARLRVGTALLEVTAELHLGCASFATRFGPDALRWVNAVDNRHQRLRGVHTRVIGAGRVTVGDAIERS